MAGKDPINIPVVSILQREINFFSYVQTRELCFSPMMSWRASHAPSSSAWWGHRWQHRVACDRVYEDDHTEDGDKPSFYGPGFELCVFFVFFYCYSGKMTVRKVSLVWHKWHLNYRRGSFPTTDSWAQEANRLSFFDVSSPLHEVVSVSREEY